MASLSSLAPITTAATALSNLILVTPETVSGYQPQNPPSADGSPSPMQQPPSFIFNYEGEQTVTLESDITDHYIEDNTAIQDQIALKPEMITTHGFVAELNDIAPFGLQTLQSLANKLTTVGSYVPVLSVTALIAYNEALLLYQTAQNAANSAVSSWSSITGGNSQTAINTNGSNGTIQTKQQIAFSKFYGYWKNRTLFTVQTPWALFANMAIKTLRAIQDAETRMITDFYISFKAIRTAQTALTVGLPQTFQDRAASQAGSLVDLGTSRPTQSLPLAGGLTQMGVA